MSSSLTTRDLPAFDASQAAGPLVSVRRQAWEKFKTLGWPTTKAEEWRYSSAAASGPRSTQPARAVPSDLDWVQKACVDAPRGPWLIFASGKRVAQPGSLDGLLNAETWSLHDQPERCRADLEAALTRASHGVAALNIALATDGLWCRVSRAEDRAPLHLIHLAPEQGSVHLRHRIVLEPGAKFFLLESFLGQKSEGLTNVALELVLEPGSELHYVRVQAEPETHHHLARIELTMKSGSRFVGSWAQLGAQINRTELLADLGEKTDLSLSGFFVTRGKQSSDGITVIEHRGSSGKSRQLYKGISAESSVGSFNGLVRVHADTAGNDARQTSKGLLLGEDAAINTRPQLEIHADDVQCAHGAAVGNLDPQQLFYLCSRGLDPLTAREMLTWAFAAEVFENAGVAEHYLVSIAKETLGRVVSGGSR